MSKQNELVNLARTGASGGGNKNRIINGSMALAQRATSSTSGGYVSLDRWYVNQSGGSTTFSQETNANPSETDGLQKYARLNVSSSSDFTAIFQRIEDVTSVPNGTITVSFYAKGTAPTGGLKVWCTQVFGSGGSSDVDIAEQVIASSLTSSWVRYTLNITVPSVDGKTIGTSSYFMVTIGQGTDTASTAYDLNITGVQLEEGEKASDFEHEHISVTETKCKRYYNVYGRSTGTNQGSSAHAGWCYGTTGGSVRIPSVGGPQMRIRPSLGLVGTTSSSAGAGGTMGVYTSGAWQSAGGQTWYATDASLDPTFRIDFNVSSGLPSDGCCGVYFYSSSIYPTDSSFAGVTLDAEL